MRKALLIITVLAVVGVGGWYGYNAYMANQTVATAPPSATQTQEAESAALDNVIWASGKLVPVSWAGLSPATGGTVQAIHVSEGEQITADTVLVDLDNGVLQSQVDVAAAALAETEAARDKLLAGATDAQIAAARAEVAAAEAGVALAEGGVTLANKAVDSAQAQVAIAEANYRELASHPTRATLISAQREVDLAQVAVTRAQEAYDKVRNNPNIGALPESQALQQATVTLEAAQSAYNVVAQGATPQQLAASQAQIDAAKVQVDVATAGIPSAEANVKSAQARLASAQAALDGQLKGATTEERAMSDAQVKSAQAALATARAQLRQAQIIAPFAGQVGSVLTRAGELATPGQPLVMLGDTSEMWVETTDLRETDVTRLTLEIAVEVTFDALPGRVFDGTIARIAPMSTSEQGSTNYTVTVNVADLDPSLRWGMTAFVNIRVDG